MGVALRSLVEPKQIDLDFLRNKTIVLDSYNMLYQFLTSIRGPDGALLTDSQNRVTSHLVGLFSRTTKLMQMNIKLAFVFDGKAPALKQKTIQKRMELKTQALEKFEKASKEEDLEQMRKYSARTVRLTKDLVEEAKHVINLLGLPVIQAPSEGEAQGAFMVKKGDAYAVGSQDFDALINGATRVVRNLSIAGKRKKGAFNSEYVHPEIIELGDCLGKLDIDNNQLIALSMMVGTDYNPGGVAGIGPKTALKLVKQFGSDFDALFEQVRWGEHCDVSWKEVYDTIANMPVSSDYNLKWKKPDTSSLVSYLVEERNFSMERVNPTLEKMHQENSKKGQRSLADF